MKPVMMGMIPHDDGLLDFLGAESASLALFGRSERPLKQNNKRNDKLDEQNACQRVHYNVLLHEQSGHNDDAGHPRDEDHVPLIAERTGP